MVALADPKRRSAPDVQESEETEIRFNAIQVGNGRVYVQIRKKSKDAFAVTVGGGKKTSAIEGRVSRSTLEKVKTSGQLLENVKIKMTDSTRARITNILAL